MSPITHPFYLGEGQVKEGTVQYCAGGRRKLEAEQERSASQLFSSVFLGCVSSLVLRLQAPSLASNGSARPASKRSKRTRRTR